MGKKMRRGSKLFRRKFTRALTATLYIDKQMRDHGLFQAICRVNRLDGDDKDYGYIVDYKDLFLIKERQDQVREYEQYLARIVELAGKVQNPASGMTYPKSLNTHGKRALYNNLGNDEQLAIAVDAAIQRKKKDGWRGNRLKEREVLYAIQGVLPDETLAKQIFE